jgi:hypothetical protein
LPVPAIELAKLFRWESPGGPAAPTTAPAPTPATAPAVAPVAPANAS